LTVHSDYLAFDNKDLVSAEPTSIEKSNIESFRFGIDWIRGLYFIIGRTYRIEVNDHEGNTIKIRLRSIYGIRRKKLGAKYKKIYDALHNAYFNDLGLHYVRLVHDSLPFTLAGVILTPEGVVDAKIGILSWNSIGLKAYATYFVIYDKSEPKNYHAFDYGIEWNAVLLYSVLIFILKQKQDGYKQENQAT
jgi:hypothetical protein